MTLVIMAAGMGSRFGGLKQIEPIDEYGNFILFDLKKMVQMKKNHLHLTSDIMKLYLFMISLIHIKKDINSN